MYTNDTERGGRPNTDEVLMVKLLVLQAWYGLSDPELQRQLDEKGLKVKKGVVQDASFITSDPGHAAADKPRGEEAQTRRTLRRPGGSLKRRYCTSCFRSC